MSGRSMNMEKFEFEISLGTRRYGTCCPQILVRAARTAAPRELAAVLHQLAAEAELATPATERWCIDIDHQADTTGFLYVELCTGNAVEGERALEALRRAHAAYTARRSP